MSLSSAECTEVECATEQYIESPPPVDTETDKGGPAPRKRGRDFALRIQVELDSSSDEAPTSSRYIYLCEIHRQIDHTEMLQRRLAHSTNLARSFVMHSALLWAKETLLHLRRFVPSPRFCPLPLFHCSIGGMQLQQVLWPPSAVYAAGQDYAA
jgi:hypothetical protein